MIFITILHKDHPRVYRLGSVDDILHKLQEDRYVCLYITLYTLYIVQYVWCIWICRARRIQHVATGMHDSVAISACIRETCNKSHQSLENTLCILL
jgi:hypothetical protein